MTERAKAVLITGQGSTEFLKTSVERIGQIQALYERLSRAFASSELTRGRGQFVSASGSIGPQDDALSPSERAKYNSLLDKLDKVLTLHVFVTPDTRELSRFSIGIFPSLTHLILEMVPPSTLLGLFELRKQIEVLEVVNSGITDLSKVLAKGADDKFLVQTFMPMVLPGYEQPGMRTRGSSSAPGSALASSSSTEAVIESLCWPRVQLLRLRNCGIARIDQSLHLFPNAATIDLSFNDISHVTHLHDCGALVELDISHNRIRVLSNLDRVLGNIISLDLSNNIIQSLDGLGKLYSLQNLDVGDNQIDDPCEVAHLARLPCLEQLVLAGNPISEHAAYRMQVYVQLYPRGPGLDGLSVGLVPVPFLFPFPFSQSPHYYTTLSSPLISSSVLFLSSLYFSLHYSLFTS